MGTCDAPSTAAGRLGRGVAPSSVSATIDACDIPFPALPDGVPFPEPWPYVHTATSLRLMDVDAPSLSDADVDRIAERVIEKLRAAGVVP